MKKYKQVTIRTRNQWRSWLEENHLSEERVFLISYKKHTGKKSINHRAQLEEALCFGWVDTTVKRIDEDKYGRHFVKRKVTANWSKNTLSYADSLLKEGQMSAFGKKMYEQGKKKKALDHDLPDTLEVPPDLKKAFTKNKKAKNGFENYTKAQQQSHLKWLFRAKREETRQKRIKMLVDAAQKGDRLW